MIVSPDTTVSEIVSQFPGTIRLFQRLHVAFCCSCSSTKRLEHASAVGPHGSHR